MSASEIIAELPHLTVVELQAVGQRIAELTTSHSSDTVAGGGLHVERLEGHLVLAGPRVIRQAEIEAILEEFP